MDMDICKHTKWLCENTQRLEQFAGQLVIFSTEKNDVHCADSRKRVMRFAGTKRNQSVPFVFHVPSKADLRNPLSIAAKK